MQCHQTVRRAHEMDTGPPGPFAIGFELVAHDLGNRQPGNRLLKGLLQAFGQFDTGLHTVKEQGFGLAVQSTFQTRYRGRIGTQTGQTLEQCGRGRTTGVQANADRHQFLRHGLVGGLGDDAGHMRGQAARRGERRHLRFGSGQALGPELVGQHTGKRITELLERLGRQLFHKQFDKQVLRCHSCVLPLRRPSFRSAPPTHAAPSGNPGALGSRNNSAPRCARGCGYGRCKRHARSRKSLRAHPAG